METPETTSGFSSGKFPEYKFLKYKDIVIEESQKLKKKGADAVIIVCHVGNSCDVGFDYGIWTKDSKQPECADDDEISKLIDALPPHTIDGIVQGHRHKIVHHFRKGNFDIKFRNSLYG